MHTKQIYEGPIFTLNQETVHIHDQDYIRDIIHHPGGVGILAIHDDQILLVSQFRPAIHQETLEIPAGKLEYGEDPKECGLRELNEETGWECTDLTFITSIASTPGFCDERIWIYQANNLYPSKNPLAMDEDEEISIQWISIDDAYHMVQTQQIIDAKTIIAIQHAKIERMMNL